MPSYPLETQNTIVGATMAMYNYIKKHALEDLVLDKCDADSFYILEIKENKDNGSISEHQ